MRKTKGKQITDEPKRKLSWWRLLLAILLLAGVTYGAITGWKWWKETQTAAAHSSWFASYVDVTATPTYAFEQLGTPATHNVVLSFIVSSPQNPCTPTWGASYTMKQAGVSLDLDRRIARLMQQGGTVAISFGGLRNNELALTCKDPGMLSSAYQSVIDRYHIDTIDLDLEGNGLTDTDAGKRRATAIAALQKKRRAEGKNLAVWLTLPVTPQGLSVDGTNAVSQMLANGVDISGINGMTMDYGQSRPKNQSMEQASEAALNEIHRQLGILYTKAGKNINSATLWTKIGATPMIGQNDIVNDVFTLSDAKDLNQFARMHGIGRISMWSANRDIECGENYINTKIVSDSCSGVTEDRLAFATLLSSGFSGNIKQNAGIVTTDDTETNTQTPDDPAKSPYQIWKASGTYLEGTKVVWHHNVYQAKWWTQNDMPDNPVLQAWQTPWHLLGPVLPGEKPVPQPTLPPGTYPAWTGDVEFNAGDRVLFNGVPYQAKWWTKGDSPAASTSNPDTSPWVPLTAAQVAQIAASQNR